MFQQLLTSLYFMISFESDLHVDLFQLEKTPALTWQKMLVSCGQATEWGIMGSFQW